ncbi:hypothetical protein PHYBLDRAFT_150341 [Phycomyces blakesleeanus NRRL 1555(-)]|uniref:C2H2-type zinc finger transcription factor n=1 Tax=Phycomyces blakesleeanus (strain ATCC 8743b / DSM 1359 / FGSC 10004 / NBRC 33097 / NRRL 1555) TaxID=763407 RepID=A0A163D4V5_PHYB8|nr:hypothetical protein PHYBLDRAFT_150341 [Phycomyces blakesleeanus NRRL 1555(-)]OAD68750.1 hypothetical protein PHYBLDRAFT_150341 [Phycomyces blakesleeanus NRRL 1555(-)]|eukprot:XP_018286790.1 hypothetical protein PHYBLDRAFT_150341 [Phycomyces blakesleeanus NRRL 1555(-)]
MENHFTTKRNTFLTPMATYNQTFVCTICETKRVLESLQGLRRHYTKKHPNEMGEYEKLLKRRPAMFDGPSSASTATATTTATTNLNNDYDETTDNEDTDTRVEYDSQDHIARMTAEMRTFQSLSHAMNAYSNEDSSRQTSYWPNDFADIFTGPTRPFKSKVEFILHALFYGNEDLASERSIKKIMFAMKMVLDICEESGVALDFLIPNAVINYHKQKKNQISVFPTASFDVVNQDNEQHVLWMNKPSDYIKFTMTCPGKSSQILALPDFMENQRLNLNQGEKWKKNPLLQHPMITSNGMDYWVGNVVEVYGGHDPRLNHPDDTHFLRFGNSTNFAVSTLKYTIEVHRIMSTVQKDSNLFLGRGFSVSYCPAKIVTYALTGVQSDLWLNKSRVEELKRRLPDSGSMKVVVCPLNLYSDDTSENALFICTSNHTLNAIEMLPPIVNDLVRLEKGIEMYSEDHSEGVLVVAPLLLFMGDNPCQSQLAMHKGTSAKKFCQKCLIPLPRIEQGSIPDTPPYSPVDHHGSEERTRDFLCTFANANSQSELYLNGCKLSYIKNGSEEFLRLEAFDPTKDMPVKILHIIPLGLTKYLMTFLWKQKMLTTSEKGRLQEALNSYKTFLPGIMSKLFSDKPLASLFIKALHALGRLSSLVYMRGVDRCFDYYIAQIKHAVTDVTDLLFQLDVQIHQKGFSKLDFTFKPKFSRILSSILYFALFSPHNTDDIVCFDSVLQYKTENGEQFNKFICEHLFKTNHHFTSRDVATRFGKQFICWHLCNGGSYVVEKPAGNGTRSVRSSIGDFVKLAPVNFPGFNLHFFGSRVNSDNSGLLTPTLCNTLAGVFQSNGQLFLGQVKIVQARDSADRMRKTFFMQKYQIVPNSNVNCIYTPAVIMDNYNNIVILPLGGLVEVNKDDINIVQAVDIHLSIGSSNNQKFLNVAKFGMFWWMLMNIAKIY